MSVAADPAHPTARRRVLTRQDRADSGRRAALRLDPERSLIRVFPINSAICRFRGRDPAGPACAPVALRSACCDRGPAPPVLSARSAPFRPGWCASMTVRLRLHAAAERPNCGKLVVWRKNPLAKVFARSGSSLNSRPRRLSRPSPLLGQIPAQSTLATMARSFLARFVWRRAIRPEESGKCADPGMFLQFIG